MNIYLAGAMRGRPKFNKDAFDRAAADLRRMGHTVFSPSEHDHELWPFMYAWPGYESGDLTHCPDFDETAVMRWDFQAILNSDIIALLPDWEKSVGVHRERMFADWVGVPVYGLDGVGMYDCDNRYIVLWGREEKATPSPKEIAHEIAHSMPLVAGCRAYLPEDSAERKRIPLYSGCIAYFPGALIEIAKVSQEGNDKHNPGEPLHWAREKSTDHEDCIQRHTLDALQATSHAQRVKHLAYRAWRANAALELAIEANKETSHD